MKDKTLNCPSSIPTAKNAKVFAIVVGEANSPTVKYLKKPLPVSEELLDKVKPVSPTEVFRFTSQCMKEECMHYKSDSGRCSLAERTIHFVSDSSDELIPCAIRKSCVWWNQEGKSACLRCSHVVRDGYPVSQESINATTPPMNAE